MAGDVVEGAAARYQAQGREAGRVVDGFRREPGLQVLTHTGDAESSGDPVGEPHVDEVSRAKRPQAVEDGRPVIAVDVTFNNGRPDLAGGHRVLVPGRQAGPSQRRHLHGAVGFDAKAQEYRVHANGRNLDGDRC